MPIDPRMVIRDLDIPDYAGDRIRRASVLQQEAQVAELARRQKRQAELDTVLREMGPNPTPEGINRIFQVDPGTGMAMRKEYDIEQERMRQEQNRIRDDERATAAAATREAEAARAAQFAAVKEREKANEETEKNEAKRQLELIKQGAYMVHDLDAEDISGWRTALEKMVASGLADDEDAAKVLQADGATRAAYRKELIGKALSLNEVALRDVLKSESAAKDSATLSDYKFAVGQGYKGTLDDWRNKRIPSASGGTRPNSGSGLLAGDEDRIKLILSNPSAYARLPVKTRDRLMPELSRRGFNTDKPNNSPTREAAIGIIDDLYKGINTNTGLWARIAGGARNAASKANYDDDVALYNSMIEGALPTVARALGHTGVLTENDIKSVKQLFPAPGESKSLADGKMANIRRLMGQGQQNSPNPAPQMNLPKVGDTIPGIGTIRSIKKKGQ